MSQAPPPHPEALLADVRVSHEGLTAFRRALVKRARERPGSPFYTFPRYRRVTITGKTEYNWLYP